MVSTYVHNSVAPGLGKIGTLGGPRVDGEVEN